VRSYLFWPNVMTSVRSDSTPDGNFGDFTAEENPGTIVIFSWHDFDLQNSAWACKLLVPSLDFQYKTELHLSHFLKVTGVPSTLTCEKCFQATSLLLATLYDSRALLLSMSFCTLPSLSCYSESSEINEDMYLWKICYADMFGCIVQEAIFSYWLPQYYRW